MRAFFFFFVSQKIFESSVTNAAALIENGKFGERARPHILNIIEETGRLFSFHLFIMYSCHINDGSNVNYRVAGTHMVKLFSELPASACQSDIGG